MVCGFGTCTGTVNGESIIEGIISVAAFASREGFDIGSLILTNKALSLIADSERIIKTEDGWKFNSPYGPVELIGQDP